MNRILSIFIVASMLMSSLGIQASAESLTSQIRYSDFKIVEATDVQKRLTYMEDTTRILDVDGLKFKDLDKDGELDVYEDWRLDDETRAADLVEKLPLKQKVGLLFMGNVNGRPDDLDPYSFTLTEDNRDYQYMTEFGLTNFLDNATEHPCNRLFITMRYRLMARRLRSVFRSHWRAIANTTLGAEWWMLCTLPMVQHMMLIWWPKL